MIKVGGERRGGKGRALLAQCRKARFRVLLVEGAVFYRFRQHRKPYKRSRASSYNCKTKEV